MSTLSCVCNIIPWDSIFDQRKPCAVRLHDLLQGWGERCPLCSLLFGSLLVQNDLLRAMPVGPGCSCLGSGLLMFTGKLEEASLVVKAICDEDERKHINRLALSIMAHNGAFDPFAFPTSATIADSIVYSWAGLQVRASRGQESSSSRNSPKPSSTASLAVLGSTGLSAS
jgi:hypothetical protein